MLAMEVNDNAGSLAPRGVLGFIVGTPPGACSLLHAVIRNLPLRFIDALLALGTIKTPHLAIHFLS
jgi:hypothetical protein